MEANNFCQKKKKEKKTPHLNPLRTNKYRIEFDEVKGFRQNPNIEFHAIAMPRGIFAHSKSN